MNTMDAPETKARTIWIAILLWGIAIGWITTMVPGIAGGATESTSETLLQKAYRLTRQGDSEGGYACYQQLVKSHPDSGIPALGRFLRLRGTSQQQEEFRSFLSDRHFPHSDLLRTRGWIALGDPDRAIECLQASDAVRRGTHPEAVLLLGQLLGNRGDSTDAHIALYRGLMITPNPEGKTLLFKALVSTPPLKMDDHPTSLLKAMETGIELWNPSRNDALHLVDPVILGLQQNPRYFNLRPEYLNEAENIGWLASWFVARLLIREERHEEALQYLTRMQKQETLRDVPSLVLEEMAFLHRSLGNLEKAAILLEAVSGRRDGPEAAQAILETAGIATEQKQYDKSIDLLKSLDPVSFDPDTRRRFYGLYLNTAARMGDIASIVNIYNRAATDIQPDEFSFYSSSLFDSLPETQQHRALEAMARERLRSDPTAHPHLWRLIAEIGVQERSTPTELEAMYQWTRSLPGDVNALSELAKRVVPVAGELSTANPDDLAVPLDEVEKLFAIAEASLQQLILSRPYDPTYSSALIQLYRAKGDEEKARAVPDLVLNESSPTSLLGVLGYALSTNGFPERGMALYDRALRIEPGNVEIQMNRAACLTRLDRFEEAAEFYRTLIENGVHGKAYHLHELIGRLWMIELHLEREKECLTYFRSLDTHIQGDWIDEAIRDVAALMGLHKRFDLGEEFFLRLQDRAITPAEKARIAMDLASLWMKAEQFDKAEHVCRENAATLPDDSDTAIELQQTRAESLVKLGKVDDALQLLNDLASQHASNPIVWDGLYRAGQIAEESGFPKKARSFYRKFLDTPSTRFHLRNLAESRIETLTASE